MTTQLSDLPDYASPPLAEVVLSIQFEPLSEMRAAHLGWLWREFADRYPHIEEHPALPPTFETFAGAGQAALQVQFQLTASPPVPRIWLLSEGGNRLLQVQQDRFIHNWRKVGEGDAYPRYEKIRKVFEEELGVFTGFLKQAQLGEVFPNQCEVAYLNFIEPGDCWSEPGEIEKVLTVWAAKNQRSLPSNPEEVRVALKYLIEGIDGKPVGRLHVSLDPARRPADNAYSLRLNLIARGRPLRDGVEGALDFCDLGRERIVRAFADLTSDCLQKLWGKINA